MIHILPYEHLEGFDFDRFDASPGKDTGLFLLDHPHTFLPNGRQGIAAILSSLALEPTDEVYITNSTGQTYIPSCVTCTVFNFCQPTRVLTKATRAILIIHEYGIPHPKLRDLVSKGHEHGIPVIEDCAHTMDSHLDGRPLGSFGSYAIYSLSKIFPVQSGGLLIGQQLPRISLSDIDREATRVAEREFHRYWPFLECFSARRRQNFIALRQFFKHHTVLFELDSHVTPYSFGVFLENALRIRRESNAIQWGSTLRDDLLLIPTNPMIESERLLRVVKEVLDAHS